MALLETGRLKTGPLQFRSGPILTGQWLLPVQLTPWHLRRMEPFGRGAIMLMGSWGMVLRTTGCRPFKSLALATYPATAS